MLGADAGLYRHVNEERDNVEMFTTGMYEKGLKQAKKDCNKFRNHLYKMQFEAEEVWDTTYEFTGIIDLKDVQEDIVGDPAKNAVMYPGFAQELADEQARVMDAIEEEELVHHAERTRQREKQRKATVFFGRELQKQVRREMFLAGAKERKAREAEGAASDDPGCGRHHKNTAADKARQARVAARMKSPRKQQQFVPFRRESARRTSLFQAAPEDERKPAEKPAADRCPSRAAILRDIYIRDLGKEHAHRLDAKARKLDQITATAAKSLADAKPKFRNINTGFSKLANLLSIQTAEKIKQINKLKEDRRKLQEKVFDKNDFSSYADLKYEI